MVLNFDYLGSQKYTGLGIGFPPEHYYLLPSLYHYSPSFHPLFQLPHYNFHHRHYYCHYHHIIIIIIIVFTIIILITIIVILLLLFIGIFYWDNVINILFFYCEYL